MLMAGHISVWQRLRRRIVTTKISRLVMYFAVSYFFCAILFALLYATVPDGISNNDKKAEPADYLYFSFVTQSTTGYGDWTPKGWARLVASAHSTVGLLLSSVATGLITYFLIRRQSTIQFVEQICYDPVQHTFLFRFHNNDLDALINVRVQLILGLDLPKELDRTINHQSFPLALKYPSPPYMAPLGIITIRSKSNGGRYIEEPWKQVDAEKVASPLFIGMRHFISVHVSATSESSGDAIAQTAHYYTDKVQCGQLIDVVDRSGVGEMRYSNSPDVINYGAFNEIEPTAESECRRCPFHNECPLDLATRLRKALLTPLSKLAANPKQITNGKQKIFTKMRPNKRFNRTRN